MKELYTNAAEMARRRGQNDKSFRARLRRNLPEMHTEGSWKVLIGSEKHRRMEIELAALEAKRA